MQTLSWRWIFFATLPVAIVTFVLACVWLNAEMPPKKTARLLNLSLLTDPLLRFSMLVYVCVPGIFIGVNVTGMYYLQSEASMTPAATGMLMLPWSAASFMAIMVTGRYFNRVGPRPLVVIGCLYRRRAFCFTERQFGIASAVICRGLCVDGAEAVFAAARRRAARF